MKAKKKDHTKIEGMPESIEHADYSRFLSVKDSEIKHEEDVARVMLVKEKEKALENGPYWQMIDIYESDESIESFRRTNDLEDCPYPTVWRKRRCRRYFANREVMQVVLSKKEWGIVPEEFNWDNIFLAGGATNLKFLEIPRCNQGSLHDWKKESDRSPPELQNIVRQIAAGIRYVHDKCIVHKDIKPSNILVHNNRAMLADFDISSDRDEEMSVYQATTILGQGTPDYQAPEVKHFLRATEKSDIYSFGVVVFWLFADKLPSVAEAPWGVENLSASPWQISPIKFPALRNLLQNALHVEPSKRPTAQDMLAGMFLNADCVQPFVEDRGSEEDMRSNILQVIQYFLDKTRNDSEEDDESIKLDICRSENVAAQALTQLSSVDKINLSKRKITTAQDVLLLWMEKSMRVDIAVS
jgi:serine/threonine protein kinase